MAQPPLRVLWADDDLARARRSRMELRRRGARVLLATTAERAVELAELFRPELFVLEEKLGTVDPGDLAGHFRSGFPSAEIILLSSNPRSEPPGAGLGLLYSGTQPIAPATLLDVLEGAFPGRLSPRAPPVPDPATILCVDDDPEMLRSLDRLLTRHGYRVRSFQDGHRVLDEIPGIAPDLAILDVRMPGLDGRTLAREIRREYRDRIPLVMLSARSSSDDVAAGMRDGASAYLAKPCRPDRVLDVVDYYVGGLDAEEREALELEGIGR